VGDRRKVWREEGKEKGRKEGPKALSEKSLFYKHCVIYSHKKRKLGQKRGKSVGLFSKCHILTRDQGQVISLHRTYSFHNF
jgi:hypothetical protein